ncbi:serine protease hepsin isoform X1 [Mobula birostris]|uniref:serine protease hepsin isoform X1 n=1 Tax=Mobula birostris TaxID=1983395 RepID=UPI003B283150
MGWYRDRRNWTGLGLLSPRAKEDGVQSGPKKQQGPSHPAKKAIIVAVTTVCLLAAAAAVTCFVVVFHVRKSNTELYDVQVSGGERLTIYDSERGIWRFICSSPGNNDVARLGCEQMGFVRMLSVSESRIEDPRLSRTAQFYCVNMPQHSGAGKLQEVLFPCSCPSRIALSVQCQDCGRRKLQADRIVGGRLAELGRWPWQVALLFDGSPLCGGSLIADDWVVTAAHCFPQKNRFANRWAVLSGSVSRLSPDIQTPVQTVVYHAGYQPFIDYNSEDNSNDIAVLRLRRSLNFSDHIQPVCLPALGQGLVEGTLCTVTGWGNTEYYGHQSDELREAEVPIVSNARCNSPEFYNGQITPKMFCAGYSEGGVDACQGDSGGPLVCQDTLSNRSRWRLSGVVSWGTGCAMATKPGVYCRVTEYQSWVYRAMKMYDELSGIYSMD